MDMRQGHPQGHATWTCRLTFQRHASWTYSIYMGMYHGPTAGNCSKDMQHRNTACAVHMHDVHVARTSSVEKHQNAACTWSIDMHIGHATRTSAMTCSMNMKYGHACSKARQHGHAMWTCSKDMQQGDAALTCSMGIQNRQAVGTCSIDMRHGQAAWTCSMDMQHGHAA
jgi:hypothetical protein